VRIRSVDRRVRAHRTSSVAQCLLLRNLKTWRRSRTTLHLALQRISRTIDAVSDFDELAADIPLYQRSGVVGIFLEGSYEPAAAAKRGAAFLHHGPPAVEPRTDVERDLNEFFEGVYGPAATHAPVF